MYKLFKEGEGRAGQGVCYDSVRILNKGADRGRDVVLYHDQVPVAVVQCKRYKGPRLMPARGPPLWEMLDAGPGEYDPQAQPVPDYEFDKRIAS